MLVVSFMHSCIHSFANITGGLHVWYIMIKPDVLVSLNSEFCVFLFEGSLRSDWFSPFAGRLTDILFGIRWNSSSCHLACFFQELLSYFTCCLLFEHNSLINLFFFLSLFRMRG